MVAPNANIFIAFLRSWDQELIIKDASCILFLRIEGRKLYVLGSKGKLNTTYKAKMNVTSDTRTQLMIDFLVHVVSMDESKAFKVLQSSFRTVTVLGETSFYKSIKGYFSGPLL